MEKASGQADGSWSASEKGVQTAPPVPACQQGDHTSSPCLSAGRPRLQSLPVSRARALPGFPGCP